MGSAGLEALMRRCDVDEASMRLDLAGFSRLVAILREEGVAGDLVEGGQGLGGQLQAAREADVCEVLDDRGPRSK